MKWVILLAFLVQRNCISSQQLTNENVRESRQLKFEECCPCPTADRMKDYNILDNNVPSECPCRSADSDTASSIFTPTLKAAQSFARPFKSKGELKPLLNPEVDLASSVLETLRDATDQEYEEALARDVARSALQAMDSDEMPVSASTNVYNDVLSPRYKETMDVIPEASHNEETRCIHPKLSQIHEYEHFEIQPQRNLLKDFFFSKPSDLPKNVNDMDNSPSNNQENILPAKNNFLDDIKIKTNLLKSKLFTNNKGLLQRMVSDKSFDKTYYNKPHTKLPDWKLFSPSDNLKSSKLFDSNSPRPLTENTKDFSELNNNIFKNNVQNNKKVALRLRKPQQSNKYVTVEALSSEAINLPVSKEVQRFKNTKDSNADTSILNPVLSLHDDCNFKKENTVHVETTTEKNDPNVIDASSSNLPVLIPSHYSTEILDTIPSPSEINTDENQFIDPTDIPPHDDSGIENLPEKNMVPKPEQIIHNKPENSKPINIAKPTDVQDTANNLSDEKNIEEADKYIPEVVCTTENSKSEISSFYSVSTPDPITINTDVFNFPINQNEEGNINSMNAESNNQKEETSQSINNLLDNNKENKINIFPNIRQGLIKTFENMKKINDKWQENLKLNVQDALKLVNVKNNIVMKEQPQQNPVYIPEVLAIPHKSNAKTSNTPSHTLSSHDLQKMSDSILTLSSVNQNSDPNFKSSVKEVSDTLPKMDSSGAPSETITCLTPADVNSKAAVEKPLNNNKKEIIKTDSENQQHFRNLNTNIYRDKHRKSETPLKKSSLDTEVQSQVRFDENEMAAQASEPKPLRNAKVDLDNSRYLKQDIAVQSNNELDEFGKSLLNVNNFFDNVKSTISNVFSTTNENIFRQTEDNEDKINNNYRINKHGRTYDLEKPKLNLKESANFLKSPEAIQTDTHTIERYKSNWTPYKSRVAVPKSFDVRPILKLDETLDKRSRTLNNLPNISSNKALTNTFRYNSNENVGNENLGSLFRESVYNNPNSESTVLSPNIFKNNFRSPGSKNLGSLKDRTEVPLTNIHKTLVNPLRAVSSKENNRFVNKNTANENLFETMASKRNEFNEKLHAINLDLNDRLSSLSQRMADSILPSLNSHPLPQRRITPKSKSAVKNKQGLDYLRRVNSPSDTKSALATSKLNTQLRQSHNNLSVPKALKKSLISDHLSDLKSPRFHENSMSQRRPLASKQAFKSPIIGTKTYKPEFKDNKMNSVTSTIRPKTTISGLKPPQNIKKGSTLIPKISAPYVSKISLKSGEPHTLGSENILSRVLLDKKTDIDKSAVDVSSDESDEKRISNFKDINSSKQEEVRSFALTKLREALKTKMLSRDSNKKDLKDTLKSSANTDLETTSSASENVNKEIEGSLRQNVQYKCKMLCTKDE